MLSLSLRVLSIDGLIATGACNNSTGWQFRDQARRWRTMNSCFTFIEYQDCMATNFAALKSKNKEYQYYFNRYISLWAVGIPVNVRKFSLEPP